MTLILVDSNVLLRLVEREHAQHAQAATALREVVKLGYLPAIVPQALYEFWVVATRPTDVNGMGMTAAQAREEHNGLLAKLRLLRDERSIFERWEQLVGGDDVRGKSAHDARLVAVMLRHGVSRLLTFNEQDFARYREITVVTPDRAGALEAAE